MPNYDFHVLLEPLEFQDLVCDIVQLRDGIFLETYKEGRDSGIDGSYTDSTKKIIVQAKRYQQDFKKLYRDLRHIELPKVRKINPERYILGVSIDFQPKEKEKIVNLFEGYITSTSDVLSRKDINRLLGEPAYKRIELAYPKLWLPSITVFEKTLKESVYRAAYKESAEELKAAIKTSKVFVSTRIYRKALHEWSQNHVIVISGEPGVGKTTMAYLLALAYLQPDNLAGFVWANSIHDVYAMLDDEQKQVIILDDFWGSVFYDDYTRRNDENRLDKLIRRVIESNGKKRLILTTREYILQQGLQKHPALRETLDRYALICTMEEYGDDEKASILFRHLYASNLDYEYIDYLFAKCSWIVNHQNYNPRVLAIFLARELGKDYSPQEYYEELCDYFDNPSTFWKSIFVDLSQEAQIVAMLLLISSTPMRLSDMACCYQKYIHHCTNQTTVKNLGDTITELEKTMIKSFYSEEEEAVLLKFSMPAVQDFLYQRIEENSEQCIPLILQCCTFYNQLQFLLEHQSMKCSKRVSDLIVEQCILHYQDYDDSCIEYDGSWNWDVDILDDREYLHRFFHLLRCCEPERHPALFRFLETQIKDYCLTMGKGDLEAQYTDLHNLPDIIVRCIKKGMTFNGKDIIDKYYEEAFSVNHYLAMKHFQKVFPEEYSIFYKTYYTQIKRDLKNTILFELELLDDFCMDFQFDMLLDDIPNLLKEFGLRYTKEFGQKLLNLYGREPAFLNRKKATYEKPSHDNIDQEERAFEVVKEDAENWLFGPRETYLENEQIIETISKSNLNLHLKAELRKTLDTRAPHYVYDLLQTKESIKLLLDTVDDSGDKIPDLESSLIMMMLWHIGRGNQEQMKKLLGFCAESFTMIMYREEPVLRANQFLSSDVYACYLKNDVEFYEIVFGNLMIRDEQWIRFLHIPLYIFCNAFIMIMGCKDGELEAYYQDLWGENFSKFKHITRYDWGDQTSIGYADFGTYNFKRYEWEGCMYRIFEELHPIHFNQVYVEPMIKRYLDELGNGDDDSKVLKHISLCRIQLEYDKKGILHSIGCEISDELSMIDHLSISEGWNTFSNSIRKSRLKELQRDKTVCQKDEDDRWRILLYEIEDVELLKELSIYDEILKFLKEIESTYSRFLNGDYSLIRRLS
ncbi:restriction endonuclease [Desulfitobacterium sp. Sab5]|uniref:nSTAND3 domain-containing NTPase n=1 Tax=Desulfitobacterium nosdiversum TaxID=3375356 RepID=UPI003CFB05FA